MRAIKLSAVIVREALQQNELRVDAIQGKGEPERIEANSNFHADSLSAE
jgi:hypothetical protein